MQDYSAHDALKKYEDRIITVHEWNAWMRKANAFLQSGDIAASRALAAEIERTYGTKEK